MDLLEDVCRAARSRAVVFVLDELGVLGVTGEDRQSWLNGMVTNDVSKLDRGGRVEVCFTNVKGKVLAIADVWHVGDALRVVTERERIGPLVEVLERLIIMEDVTLADLSTARRVMTVQGPEAREVVKRAGLEGADSDRTGSGGVDLILLAEEKDAVLARLLREGPLLGSAEALEALRLEAALPRWSADLAGELFPQEARLDARRVSFAKGCYVGQEPVLRLQARGHANRFLTPLDLGDAEPPVAGAVVRLGEAEVGHVTSAARGPTVGRTVALAIVRREAATPGTQVDVLGVAATVGSGSWVAVT